MTYLLRLHKYNRSVKHQHIHLSNQIVFCFFSPSPQTGRKKERKTINQLLSYHLLKIVLMIWIPPFIHRLIPLSNDYFAFVQIAQTHRCKIITANITLYWKFRGHSSENSHTCNIVIYSPHPFSVKSFYFKDNFVILLPSPRCSFTSHGSHLSHFTRLIFLFSSKPAFFFFFTNKSILIQLNSPLLPASVRSVLIFYCITALCLLVLASTVPIK